jgi:hypothetical protein
MMGRTTEFLSTCLQFKCGSELYKIAEPETEQLSPFDLFNQSSFDGRIYNIIKGVKKI